uniref:Uncharacterized protein n=1 Tax=Ascaris lumbricoides TaxID=6252 RepID=A0A0M3IFD6_ASCLU
MLNCVHLIALSLVSYLILFFSEISFVRPIYSNK